MKKRTLVLMMLCLLTKMGNGEAISQNDVLQMRLQMLNAQSALTNVESNRKARMFELKASSCRSQPWSGLTCMEYLPKEDSKCTSR